MLTLRCLKLVATSLVVVLVTGCASMTGSPSQAVSIQTRDKEGREVTAANCELTNNKGKWFLTTPGSITIVRSNDDMQVLCNKSGYEPGRASVVSATKGAMFGNIILGGGIGAIIDHNSGAAYEYPPFFQVVMGTTSRIEPPTESSDQSKAASPNGSPEQGSTSAAPTAIQAPALQPVGTTPSQAKSQSVDERLKELKRLHEAGLIGNEVYLEQQRKILESAK